MKLKENISSTIVEKVEGYVITYPEVDALFRTDESYQNREQSLYHVGLSVLENLAIDMIEFFIDPMHIVYLGCMKNFLISE